MDRARPRFSRPLIAHQLGTFERNALATSSVSWTVYTEDDVGLTAALDGAPGAVLIHALQSATPHVLRLVADAAHSRAEPTPVLLRVRLQPDVAGDLRRVCATPHACRLSLYGYHPLRDDVLTLAGGAGEPGPECIVFARVLETLPSHVDQIVVAAVLISRRRSTVACLARACGVARRTLEWRLVQTTVLAPRELLAWSACLHAAWRLGVLGHPIKAVAAESGFGTRCALANHLKRHTGRTPGSLKTRQDFGALVHAFAEKLACAADHGA